jgi:hypothetical protein
MLQLLPHYYCIRGAVNIEGLSKLDQIHQ